MASQWQEAPRSHGDGLVGRMWKHGPKPLGAVFIHAGAGYHSTANEKIHLEACSEAARVGMRFLKAGATAPEAVEAAIKCLEDKEITNAGFGSNLNMDGIVECDATIVDHLGRSGACGAVPEIRNPISLAKLILDTSSQPLSLRRVPPNILVGEGARQFAEEHGMVPVHNEFLVSRNARDRYVRWSKDLKKAEARINAASSSPKNTASESRSPTPGDYERAANLNNPQQAGDHTQAILTGVWNEGQPDSPPASDVGNPLGSSSSPARSPGVQETPGIASRLAERGPLGYVASTFRIGTGKRFKLRQIPSEDPVVFSDEPASSSRVPPQDGSMGTDDEVDDNVNEPDRNENAGTGIQGGEKRVADSHVRQKRRASSSEDLDIVTDTIGAIAIDFQGHIAAGSSSGGIGMKHRGRIGPAALVGIGTAVIPEDPDDEDQTSVAAVTSGTGEHMATSLASAKCAERLHNGTRRGPGGRSVVELDEVALMESFILDDFMGHPGVRNQPSTGAIGVMAVKKDRYGVFFYFAHNTDSFALASMSSAEREPLCVMSRLGKVRPVTQGGRKL
ncbi:nucleophile aminohydrolase [Schizothecium vesticola]|uniref:Nucleophile aminohydrolase n=1 Tax=Schizothecium vesticola TaxID=314040 RepID=A0AA40EKH1_9PEZI|nr:nucleophile aminohydrolase [Schizothecium vesticola]